MSELRRIQSFDLAADGELDPGQPEPAVTLVRAERDIGLNLEGLRGRTVSERASESSAFIMSETPELTELLCFDIYAASRAITGVYRTVLAPWNLTYPQYLVLVVLGREKSCTIGYLGQVLQLDYGTLTPLLRRMEAGGLLTRSRISQDERVVTLELTGEGRELAVVTSDVQQKIRAAVGLGEQEALALQATLRVITGSVREHLGSTGD